MIAVLSATEHDFYATPLPFVVYSWAKLGVSSIVFIPKGNTPKLDLAITFCFLRCLPFKFECEEKRIPTYSQVSRLFGAALDLHPDTVLITGDSDMCVFTNYFNELADGAIHIVGNDLTPDDQYPMCYAAMPVKKWREVMGITKSYQAHVAELIDPIEGLNIRGEQWCYDQWYLKKKITERGLDDTVFHNRSNGENQFATQRADRDGWHFDPYNILDAHLPRPLTDDDNFNKVYELFKIKYPHDDLSWMREYQQQYKALL